MAPRPRCHVVAGPNGSGKSTFALRRLPQRAGDVEFVNPDLMAQGVAQFEAAGLPVPPDLWDRLAADARARLEDDLLYIEEARRAAGTGPGSAH